MDMAIRGGMVVTPAGVSQAEVGIEHGRIVAIGTDLPKATQEIDASGAYVIPGGVDIHTHLSTASAGGQLVMRKKADDFYYGTRAAAAGGVTTVCDFAYQQEGSTLADAIAAGQDIAGPKSVIDYSFHIMISDPSSDPIGEVAGMVERGFPTYKFFMPRPAFQQRGTDYMKFFHAVAKAQGLALVHCEDQAILEFSRESLLDEGKTALCYYPASRPREVEVSATARAMEIASATGVPMYIVHLSCEAALLHTRAARARGLPVYVETRPLYLYLTEELFNQPDHEAAKYVGVPPLRNMNDVNVLWKALHTGDIQTVCTDHVGYSLEEKYKEGDTFAQVPAGVSNLETLIPMLFSEGVGKGRITIERFVELIATNPAKLAGFHPRKGTIAVGADADICVLDPAKKVTVSAQDTHYATDYDVYEGFECTGWPVITISRGEVIFKYGDLTEEAGRGCLVPRGKFRGL